MKKSALTLALCLCLAVMCACAPVPLPASPAPASAEPIVDPTAAPTAEPAAAIEAPTADATPSSAPSSPPQEPTATATPESTTSPEVEVATTPADTPASDTVGKGTVIAIDAGHQAQGNSEQEPLGPGATQTKAKVSSGTRGVSTGVAEYELNLAVAFRLRDELTARGYQVVMIRESHDVDISNRERAQIAEDAGAAIFLRLHANGSTNEEHHGLFMVSPTKDNPYIAPLYADCRRLAEAVLAGMLQTTQANNRGIWETDTMSGINWASMPVVLIEMGFMTNPEEDEKMQTAAYQQKLATGIADGVDSYFQ